MPEGPPRIYKGTFCTGHVPMVGTTSIQFSENTFHEYIEEYKNAHGMKVKTGPGLAHQHDFRAIEKRPSPPLPLQGCKLAHLGTGNRPERRAKTSSQAVGGWWDDPIFARGAKLPDAVLPPGDRGQPPASLGISTSSQLGQFWHDPILEDKDEAMAIARSKNGIRRLLPIESNSQFALEDIPTQHRLL